MILRTLALLLFLCSAGLAQRPQLEVSDLLLPETPWALSEARAVVQRGVPQWLREGLEFGSRHVVSGEGRLGLHNQWSDDDRAFRGPISRTALQAALAKIRGASDGELGFARIGDRVYVDSDLPEQVAAALGELRRAMPARVSVDVILERIGADETVTLLRGVETFRNGEARVIADVVRRPVLCDFDVEIAQAAATANPVVAEVTYGASIALRARPIPLGDEVVVEAVIRVGAPISAKAMQPSAWLGPFDRVASRIDEAGLTFRLQRGQPSQHEWATLDGGRLRLTCAARWEPAEVAAGADVLVVASPMLGDPVVGFRSTTTGEPEDYSECTWVDELIRRLATAANDDAMTLYDSGGDTTCGVLLLEGERGRVLARSLAAQIDVALRGGTLTLEILDVPADLDIPSAGALPDGVRTVGHFAGPMLHQHPLCFASATERSYVRDWEVEVAQSSRIPDPKMSMLEEGWFATVRSVPGGPDRPARLEIALDVTVLRELRTVSTSISSKTIALTDASNSVLLPQDIIDVELPITVEQHLVAAAELDQRGAVVLRRAATSIFGPGRALVIRARVR